MIKIQEELGCDLNNFEKEACSKLQIENVPEQQQALADECGMNFAQDCAIRKRRKLETTSNYLNSDFILGSCAKIKCVWSHAELILRKLRHKMSPNLLEALLFCKVNKQYRDFDLVATAMLEVKKSNQERIMEDSEQQYIALMVQRTRTRNVLSK